MSRATPQLRDFARRLVTHEAKGSHPAGTGTTPALRACEKLRAPLTTLTGHAGFRALLARALALATEEVPWLQALQVRTDGSLEGQDKLQAQIPPEKFRAGSVVLLAQLLGLLVAFIGEKLTLQLVREIWPQLPLTPFASGQGKTK